MADTTRKRRLYIVGGKGKNVPSWLNSAFDYEQFDQENSKTRTLEPQKTPDAVIVLSSWIGHEHFYGARDLAERLNIPMLLSPGGWSSSLKSAADLGVDWYINDIERCKTGPALTKPQIEEVETFIDNAWREAYNREWAARKALERRYSKTRTKLEIAQDALVILREKDAAAQRVIAEIREAATAQRKVTEDIQDRSARVTHALIEHMAALENMFDAAEESHASLLKASTRLSDVRNQASSRLDSLKAALTIAEDGLATIRLVGPQTPMATVFTSNTGTDS